MEIVLGTVWLRLRFSDQVIAGYTEGRRPVGKPRGTLKDAVWGDTVSLLQTQDWEVAPTKRGGWSNKIR